MQRVPNRESVVWRIIFAAAAMYNLCFGIWAISLPNSFFERFKLGVPTHPWVWSCLGMVIGIYGLGYAYVAWKPDRGDVLAALGLLGKILGPLGWLHAVSRGEIPIRTFPLILFDDLIWWFPFGAYLLRRFQWNEWAACLFVAFAHCVACVLLICVAGGTAAQAVAEARFEFVQHNILLWCLCWISWTVASLGLATVFVVWGRVLARFSAAWRWDIVAWLSGGIGLMFDLSSEVLSLIKLSDNQMSLGLFQFWSDRITVLGPGIGNAMYCACGLIMTAISWRCRFQRNAAGVLAFATWCIGLVLSAAAFLQRGDLMTEFGAILMACFIPWTIWTALQMRRLNFEHPPREVRSVSRSAKPDKVLR
jgi:small multidrug resistance pump